MHLHPRMGPHPHNQKKYRNANVNDDFKQKKIETPMWMAILEKKIKKNKETPL